MQFGICEGRGTTDEIFKVRQPQEKAIEENERLYCAIVNLEKAYNTSELQGKWYTGV